jgi:hypothetical protein
MEIRNGVLLVFSLLLVFVVDVAARNGEGSAENVLWQTFIHLSIMKFLVAVFHLVTTAACVTSTLYKDALSIYDGLRQASQIFQSADASRSESVSSNQDTSTQSLRSFTPLTYGSLATNEYVLIALFKPSSMCNEFYAAFSYETNVCIPATVSVPGSTDFFLYTAQPTGAVETLYSDASCMTKIKETSVKFQKTCEDDSMVYTTPSIALPYTVTHVEIR